MPRLPSADDEYETLPNVPAPSSKENVTTKDRNIRVDPSSSYSWTSESTTKIAPHPESSTLSHADVSEPPARLLGNLSHAFQRVEQSLYVQLSQTPRESLNDVRRSFLYAAKGAEKRLLAWQKKHMLPVMTNTAAGKAPVPALPLELAMEEPEWWGKKCHVFPGANVIVNEDDWASIISFTLR